VPRRSGLDDGRQQAKKKAAKAAFGHTDIAQNQ